VFKLGRQLAKLVRAKLELKSKAERGYDLIEHKPIQAVRVEKIKLRRGTSTADAFRIIARSTLRHITANETAVQMSDSEGVHQMRVGLRRLRAAISLFSKLFGDKQTERIKSELNWLETGELSPARDLDVYERGTVEPLRRAAPATRGMKELEDALADAPPPSPRLRPSSTRHVTVLSSSIRCNGLKLEIGPSARVVFAINPSNGSPRIFSRDVLRTRPRKQKGCASLTLDSATSCGSP
jgi:hypothetical protein